MFGVAIPDLDLLKIRTYAAAKVPVQFRDEIRVEVDVRGKFVTIVECRQPWREDMGREWTRQGVARMKHDDGANAWTLSGADGNGRWHVFDLVDPGSIDEILSAIELDQSSIFWG